MTWPYNGEKLGVSYRKFQEITGLSHATLQQIESAANLKREHVNSCIRYETIVVLAPFLGYEPQELIRACDGVAQFDLASEQKTTIQGSDEGYQMPTSAEEIWRKLDRVSPNEIFHLIIIAVKRSRFSRDQILMLMRTLMDLLEEKT
jgi:hypothetical protein